MRAIAATGTLIAPRPLDARIGPRRTGLWLGAGARPRVFVQRQKFEQRIEGGAIVLAAARFTRRQLRGVHDANPVTPHRGKILFDELGRLPRAAAGEV